MKEVFKLNLRKRYLIIVGGVLASFVGLYTVWVMFPAPLDKGTSVVKAEEKQKTGIEQKSDPVRELPVASPQPVLAPDYSIPSAVNGFAPVIYTVPTDQNIVFLGIDDGVFKDQSVVDIMKKDNIKASLFLTRSAIGDNPDFFTKLIDLGSYVEDHTLSHDTNMTKAEGYDQQKAEICGMADYEFEHYGRRPIFFRPPGGEFSDAMRQAAADCGMKAVVTWIAKVNGGSIQYQIGDKLRPGDVVLMHFRPEFAQDMKAFVDAMNASGLHTALLEDALM